MIRKLSLILIAILFGLPGFSQDKSSGDTMSDVGRKLQKLKWEMNIGTSYSFFSNYGGAMNYYAAPGFIYPINDRFSFHGGIVTGVFSHFQAPGNESAVQAIQSGYTSFYGSVSYRLNPDITFYGTGVKSLANYGQINPFYLNGYDEISFGSTVRLGENVTVGASVHFRNYKPGVNEFSSPFFDRNPW